MDKEVYIDGDILPYRVGFVTQRTLYSVEAEGVHSCTPVLFTKSKAKVNKFVKADPDLLVHEYFYVEQPMQAISTLQLMIKNIVQGCRGNGKRFKVVLSGPTNFRNDVATIQPYKGNRKDFVKPVHFDLLRDWLAGMPYTIFSDNEEADDVLSRACLAGHTIATIDKDLNNTPGTHYNLNTGNLYEVSEEEAMHNFYMQTLVGDTADNIPGIRGIGPAKASKALAGCTTPAEYEDVILSIYSDHYEDAVAALTEVGQLLWMRREEGEMWEPEAGHGY